MTSTPNTTPSEGPIYPTEWHPIDILSGIDCRQLSDDTYQLRSPNQILVINTEGFNLYRDESATGVDKFHEWCAANGVTSQPRDDL